MLWWSVAAFGVTGGSPTSEFPAVVSVGTVSNPHICSGALVGVRTVVVPAGCEVLLAADRGVSRVVFGANDGSGQAVNVQGMQAHPAYSDTTFAHGLAVLTLEADAPASPMAVRPSVVDVATVVQFVGYGVTDDAADDAGTRRQVTVTVTDRDDFLLYTYAASGNACFGDGPLIEIVGSHAWLVGMSQFLYSDVNDPTPLTPCAGGSAGSARIDTELAWLGGFTTLDTTLPSETDADTDADTDSDTDTDVDTDPAGDTDTSVDTDSSAPSGQDDAPGCGCTGTGPAPAGAFALAALAAASRRRAGRAARG